MKKLFALMFAACLALLLASPLFASGDFQSPYARYLYSSASDPAFQRAGQVYYNTTSNTPKFYNGTSWTGFGTTLTDSASLRSALSDETGTGAAFFQGGNVGAATATSINGNTFTSGSYTLTGGAGKTLTFNNSLTFAGTDGTTHTFPSTTSAVARTDAAQTFTGDQVFSGAISSGTTPAASGQIRLPNAGAISGRNHTNNGDVIIARVTNASNVSLGADLWVINTTTGIFETSAGQFPIGWVNQAVYLGPSATTGALESNNGTQGTFRDFKARQYYADATMTAAGTTGAQTINKAAGSVNFAAGASSLVVTNNLVTASSIVICTVQTNDGTLKSVACVPASGSFTMHANAAATGETAVGFWVLNK